MKWHRCELGYTAKDSLSRIWLICDEQRRSWRGKCIVGKHSESSHFPIREKKLADLKRKLSEMSEYE